MNRRELIIIATAVIVGAYAVLDFFVLSGDTDSKAASRRETERIQTEEFAAVAGASLVRIQKMLETGNPEHLVAMIESEWPKDPFIVYEKGPETRVEMTGSETGEAIPDLLYSGFIQAGNNLMAVVNGMEYRIGETIVDTTYKIHRITPFRIVLLADGNREIILSLEEN